MKYIVKILSGNRYMAHNCSQVNLLLTVCDGINCELKKHNKRFDFSTADLRK